MSQLIIASQLDEDFNDVIRQRLAHTHPDARLIDVPSGVPSDLPTEVSILLARPINVRGYLAPDTPPPGWPYGLKWVQVVSSGIDFYPQWLFNGPPVSTSRGSAAENIAEFALAAIFAAAKRLPDIWVHDSQWNFTALTPLKGTTLGILGFGAIGRSLASKAHALGINVLALRQSQTPFEVEGVEAARDIHDLFARSDHLVLAAPLTGATRHIVNSAVLASAKPGLHLINIARGGLLDHGALLEALDSGTIGLASLDVTDPEPLPDGHPLYTHPRVRLSPHTSAISTNSGHEIADSFLANLERYLNGLALENQANVQRGY
ncbi:Phosphoglycerate dehydrogenase [Pseudomonas lundensis]|uniref:D-isomer specific 2-hydroxyacid dehydrogenase n=3 Tax=Pseudomonas TaxID=286 RepID=A0A449IS25_PSEFR|nr:MULTISPECIES: D-isomer specific 2-hydroxyacid dehydrogenase family protein [Pseudomonas]MCP1505889.1 phosphoglycerate dehydrogenase-like enzyme [Pseudomonas marginalis]MCP1523393.1 phosphoglycerate dehydrogenase-like enzyme [Pseudomonas marginalis]MDQ0501758.1 phosphoglycerate dehydrogenase-like enzyme [Pseudomonas marginalis]NMY13102.1 dihydrofolate reductase [Pseudomonas veronii]OZY35694.1 dihydrofolate reductase [Pseudomonas lundensis]